MNKINKFKIIGFACEFIKWIQEENKGNILEALASKEESKEILEKNLELEEDNYKIDKEMSVEEKVRNWWERIDNIDSIIKDYRWWKKISVLRKNLTPNEKDEKNKAFVREYIDDWSIPKEYVGEQKFNRFAVERLWLIDRLPKNIEELNKIQWNIKNTTFLNKYFSKNNKPLFSGYWESSIKVFINIWWGNRCRFWNGGSIEFEKDGSIIRRKEHYQIGLSVRLVKDRL